MFESLAVRFGNMSLPLTKSFLSITAQLVNTYTIKGNTQNLVFSNLIPGAGFWSRVPRTRGLVAWANSSEICTLHPDTSAGPGQVLGLQYTIGNLKTKLFRPCGDIRRGSNAAQFARLTLVCTEVH